MITPTIKGLITGALMIAASLAIYDYLGNFENQLQYITYAIYIAGLAWTLIAFSRREVLKNFKTYFTQGFKCFIVVTLMMVAFTYSFIRMNPSMKEEMAQNYRTQLLAEGNKTAAEIESAVIQSKEYYNTMVVSMAIFGYLLIGSIVTVLLTVILMQLNRNGAPDAAYKYPH